MKTSTIPRLSIPQLEYTASIPERKYLITKSRQIEGAGTPRPRYHTGLTTKEQRAHQSISLDQQAGRLMRPASTHKVILGSPTSYQGCYLSSRAATSTLVNPADRPATSALVNPADWPATSVPVNPVNWPATSALVNPVDQPTTSTPVKPVNQLPHDLLHNEIYMC